MSSTMRQLKPHSLSYHARILTKLLLSPRTIVLNASNVPEYVLCKTSLLTIGSSVYSRMPLSSFSQAFLNAAFMSSLVTSWLRMAVRSTHETSGVGTRSAMPFILPLQVGRTRPIAFAAPVLVGMMLTAAARARRKSLWTMSWTFWSFVYEWAVVMKAFSRPKLSLRTLLTGARQLVVQLALLIMLCFSGSYVSLFTPRTNVASGFSASALMRTFFAPAVRCFEAPSRLVKKPVDSTARKTPRSFQGSIAGSFWAWT